jgi:hypothetical protein
MEGQSFKLLSKASTFLDWAKVARVREAAPCPCRAAWGHGAMGPCGQCQPRIQPHVTASSSQTRASARFAKAKYECACGCLEFSIMCLLVQSSTVQYSPVQSSPVQYRTVQYCTSYLVQAYVTPPAWWFPLFESTKAPSLPRIARLRLSFLRLSQLLPDPCPLRWHLIRRPPAGLLHQFVFIFPSSSDRDAHYRGSQLERPRRTPDFCLFLNKRAPLQIFSQPPCLPSPHRLRATTCRRNSPCRGRLEPRSLLLPVLLCSEWQ